MNSSTNATKRWWYIMPIVFIAYSLVYLSRANSNFASAASITEDLDITKGISSLLGALFFLGYFFFQIPGVIYAERRSVRKLIFICLILWDGCVSLTDVVHNIPALAAIRPILGVVGAAMIPAMLIYINSWFTKSERSRANAFLILSNPVTILWVSVISSYLIQAFDWREMFIIEGVPTVIWAFCWWVLIEDRPLQINWLAESEKAALQEQLDRERQGTKVVRNYGEAFRSRSVILLCTQYFAWSIGVYGFILWLPSIICSGDKNMGTVEVGWLSSVPYLAATIVMIVVSWTSDKMQNRRLFIWPLLLIGGLASIGSWAAGANRFQVSYTLLVVAGTAMCAPYDPFFTIIPEVLPHNVAGGAMALVNSMGVLGSFCGLWFTGYLSGVIGSPAASYIFMGVVLFASVLLALIIKPANNRNIPLGAHHA